MGVRRVDGGIPAATDTTVYPPGSNRAHPVLLANVTQRPVGGFAIDFMVQMALSHELIQGIVN
jgi:hypothetical protein